MKTSQMKSVIEGLLFAVGAEGLDMKQLSEVLEMDRGPIEDCLRQMQAEYKKEHRGLQIVELAGQYQLTTRPDHAEYFKRLAFTPSSSTLSQAALETLAIVAYKQPITRIEIEEIRGVKTDRALHTLAVKELVKEVGRAEAVGRPILYGTTAQFLDYLGLNSLKDLPDFEQFEFDESVLEEDLFFDRFGGESNTQITMEELSEQDRSETDEAESAVYPESENRTF